MELITDTQMGWYNFRTNEYEYRDTPTADAEALDYMPQLPGVKGAYECHRKLGKSVLEAMALTLDACTRNSTPPEYATTGREV